MAKKSLLDIATQAVQAAGAEELGVAMAVGAGIVADNVGPGHFVFEKDAPCTKEFVDALLQVQDETTRIINKYNPRSPIASPVKTQLTVQEFDKTTQSWLPLTVIVIDETEDKIIVDVAPQDLTAARNAASDVVDDVMQTVTSIFKGRGRNAQDSLSELIKSADPELIEDATINGRIKAIIYSVGCKIEERTIAKRRELEKAEEDRIKREKCDFCGQPCTAGNKCAGCGALKE